MSNDSKQNRLERLIADYLQSVESGDAHDRDAIIVNNPGLADELRSFFANHDAIQAANEDATRSLKEPPSEQPTIVPNPHDDATIPPPDSAADTEPVQAAGVGTTIKYFGDYELIEEIARGGMGVVYKARQVKLNRTVALKMILAGQLASDDDVKRFYTEAEAAANLDHPGIVPIHEIGEHEDQHYFSMSFVEGDSLADRIKDGPLPPREAAEITKKVAEAIAYAHERGVIHRDLKPGNILMDANGEPRVTDFGLAKKVEGGSDLTATGQILGTPSYMPPEQAAGKIDEIDERADVYSLGAVLYALLTGRPPFQAASAIDTLMQVMDQEPVSPRVLNPGVPVDLETICLKLLEKDTRLRYGAAGELIDELLRFIHGEPIKARPISFSMRGWRWCKRNPLGATVACLLVILGIGGPVAAVNQTRLATKQKRLMDEQTRLAGANERLAEKEVEARRDVEEKSLELEQQLSSAHAMRLAVTSQSTQMDNPIRSLLLAIESSEVTRRNDHGLTVTAHQRLLDAMSYVGGRPLFRHAKEIITPSASSTLRDSSQDGRWLVATCDDARTRLWDMTSDDPAASSRELLGRVIHKLDIAPNGRTLVTQDRGNDVRIYDLTKDDPLESSVLISGSSPRSLRRFFQTFWKDHPC